MIDIRKQGLAVGLAAALSACGGAAVPHAQAVETQAAVRAAEEVGAAEVPRGALHLKHARDQLEVAKKLIAEGENETAAVVLRRAESDAELALALAKTEQAREEAAEADRRIERLERRTMGGT